MNGTATFPASCQEYFERGTKTNGSYKIRPSLELHSFFVECEFDESGITLIRPTDWKSEGYTYPSNESQECHTYDCYTKSIDYGISLEQIEVHFTFKDSLFAKPYVIKALTNISSGCDQKIKHICKNHRLTGISSWTGRDTVKVS